MTAAERFARLPTAAKLLLILTAVLLPIGVALTWLGETGIREANETLHGRSVDQSRGTAQGVESLIARTALSLRIAANGALANGNAGACDRAARSIAIAPGVSQQFSLEDVNGQPVCASGTAMPVANLPLVAPGSIHAQIAPGAAGIIIRVGVNNGMATSLIGTDDLRNAAVENHADVHSVALTDGSANLPLVDDGNLQNGTIDRVELPIVNGNLTARIGTIYHPLTTLDRLVLLLPVLMWVAAALIAWLLVSRLLIRPLKRLERSILNYQPGQPLELPRKLGPSEEIQELRDVFARTITQLQESESEAAAALDGQRRLVREVHHRVKNNLQVVASLLNIHGRSARSPEARAAYASISRRVGALSIVHRNHFAEMEESRGISLRPLVTELAAELRASTPEPARSVAIELELDSLHTTQDAAVAVAFLITEIVEYSMLHAPQDSIEVSLRRTSELTGRLSLNSGVLVPSEEDAPEKQQFERIVGGLAKQLRSPLDRKLGRYSVDLPVFPPA